MQAAKDKQYAESKLHTSTKQGYNMHCNNKITRLPFQKKNKIIHGLLPANKN
jgi:hypothetical protein